MPFRIVKRLAVATATALILVASGCGDTDSPEIAFCSAAPETTDTGALACRAGTSLKALELELSQATKTRTLFSTELGEIVCRQARGKAKVEVEDETVKGAVTDLEFAWCKPNVDFCSTVNELTIDTPIEPLQIHYLGARPPQGKLVLMGPSAYVSLACAFIGEVACIYGARDVLAGAIENPPAQRLRFDARLKLTRGVESCPPVATMRMTMDVNAVNMLHEDGGRLQSGRVWVAKE